MKTVRGVEELQAAAGTELGTSPWHAITQERIDAFAAATGDHYWLHVDPARAADSALGSTIAHGLLTLSLGPQFNYALVTFEGFAVTLNYGYDKVRFLAPLPVGSRVRMHLRLGEVQVAETSARAQLVQTFEREGAERPVCVAEQILHFVR